MSISTVVKVILAIALVQQSVANYGLKVQRDEMQQTIATARTNAAMTKKLIATETALRQAAANRVVAEVQQTVDSGSHITKVIKEIEYVQTKDASSGAFSGLGPESVKLYNRALGYD